MRDFFDWIREGQDEDRPWLILGKGPSFGKHVEYDLTKYRTMTLNHAVTQLSVEVAHMIDLDVADLCEEAIVTNAKFLLMPWVPHQGNAPGKQSLDEICDERPFMQLLVKQGRLLYYNHLADRRHGDSPLVRVRYFSSEAAINLLAASGVRTIRTLGIDGGASYSGAFNDLNEKTLLANGRKSFNKQFGEIAHTIMTSGIDLAPLDIDSPVKVYVATTEAQMLAVKVLEYSIRKHASMSAEVIPLHMNDIEVPQPADIKNWPRTPFSFQRFLIPQLQAYQGRAIYLDSDMQVFRDIKELWTYKFTDSQVLTVRNIDESDRKPQFSVMLLDCGRLSWDIRKIVQGLDDGELSYEQLMYEMAIAKTEAAIDASWNSLEHYDEGKTSLLHYTDMDTQPWVSRDNPLAYLWVRDLIEALDNGAISMDYVKRHIELGYVRPSLMFQIEHKIDDSLLLPAAAVKLDANYRPPYQGMANYKYNRFKRLGLICKARARKLLELLGWFKCKHRLKNFLFRD